VCLQRRSIARKESMRSSVGPLERVNPLWTDLLFPFYTRSQFVFLCGMVGATYLGARLFDRSDALIIAAIAWASGTLQLSTVAPGRLRLPLVAGPDLREILTLMRFAQIPGSVRWSYGRLAWMKWRNSDVTLSEPGSELLVEGPLSTLAYLRFQFRHGKKYSKQYRIE
jgi:hypothetical protein